MRLLRLAGAAGLLAAGLLVCTFFGEAKPATFFSENVVREWQEQRGSMLNARQAHGCASCKYVALTPCLAVVSAEHVLTRYGPREFCLLIGQLNLGSAE